MYYKIILLWLACLCFQNTSFAQDTNDVEKDQLTHEIHPLDSAASAAYLLSKLKVSYTFNQRGAAMILTYHYRIRIYNKAGEKYGDFTIPLYTPAKGEDEKLNQIKAFTYNLDGKSIEKTKLSKKDIYAEQVSENWTIRKFAMPEVKPGSVVDVRYTISTPYLHTIPMWYFQKEIPTNYSELVLVIPEMFGITPIATGSRLIAKEEKEMQADQYMERWIRFRTMNVPAVKEDKFVLNTDDYRSGIKYEIHSFAYPDGRIEYFSKDWVTIGDLLLSENNFGKEIDKRHKDYEHIIEKAIALPINERIRFIYDYVRENYQWNKKLGISVNDGLKNLYKSKSGNVGEINILLLHLLQKSGVEAYPFATKYRFNGLLNESYPSLSELDYLLVYVKTTKGSFFLDATSKYFPLGSVPVRAINICGLLINKESSKILATTNPNINKSASIFNVEIVEDGPYMILEGNTRLSEYAASKFRLESGSDEEEEDKQEVMEVSDDIDLQDTEMKENKVMLDTILNFEDIYQPITMEYTAIKHDCIREIGDKLFISADFGNGIKENPFTDETRDYPVFFNSKHEIKEIYSLEIPQNYQVVSIPEKIILTTPEGTAKFVYNPVVLNDKLNVVIEIHIDSDYFIGPGYLYLKEFYAKVLEKQEEKIVLEKKS